MAWDDTKVDGNQLTPSEWNTHVTDQKTRAVRGMTLVATALVFTDATQQLMTGAAGELVWDNTNKRLGLGTASPLKNLDIRGEARISTSLFGENVELSYYGSGNRNVFIDFIGDETYIDYGLRIIRKDGGANTESLIQHRGTADLIIQTEDLGSNIILLAASNIGIKQLAPACALVINGGLTVGDNTNAGDNNVYVVGNVSALSYTDRTPFYEGNALKELKTITGKDGKIDHESLPEFARKDEGRDLGAMISVLTKAVQQLTEKVEKLEKELNKS